MLYLHILEITLQDLQHSMKLVIVGEVLDNNLKVHSIEKMVDKEIVLMIVSTFWCDEKNQRLASA